MLPFARVALAVSLCLAVCPMFGEAREPAGSAVAAPQAAFVSDRIQIDVEGRGKDIILIPGLSSSPRIWQGTVEHLGEGWRIHRVHVRGFAGLEPGANADGLVSAPVAEELARYIAEQGLDRPAVVGHSMGGTIALMLAARHPDSVGKIMVVDMLPFMGISYAPPGTRATPENLAPIADQIFEQTMAATDEASQQHSLATLNGMIDTESLRAGPIEDALSSARIVAARANRELVLTDLRPELANITAPTTVVYVAYRSPGLTTEMSDRFYSASYARLSGASLIRIDDSAHFIMLDQPARFHAVLDQFLATD